MDKLEKDIEKAACRLIGKYGGMCLKWVCPGWDGVPDRIALLPGGRVLFLELKRPKGGQLSSLQAAWLRRLREMGFRAGVIRNQQDLDDLRIFLEGSADG